MKVDAIVLAGGSATPLGFEGALTKGLVSIDGKVLVQYVLDSLSEAICVDKVVIVAPCAVDEVSFLTGFDLFVRSDDVLTQNIERGMRALDGQNPVLVCSSDIPFLTGAAVDDFIDRCEAIGGEFCYPVIAKEVVLEEFPNTKRTYATLKEGTFTGGNMGIIYPSVFYDNRQLFEDAYSARKSPIKLFWMLGPAIIIKMVLKRLKIAEAEARCSKILNAKARVVITPFPQIGVDIDKPEDLELMQEVR